jgi:hypothetical protein
MRKCIPNVLAQQEEYMNNRPSHPYVHSLQTRYARARKKAKGVILDEFTQTTGCNRDYAIRLLRGDYTYATKPIRRPRAITQPKMPLPLNTFQICSIGCVPNC